MGTTSTTLIDPQPSGGLRSLVQTVRALDDLIEPDARAHPLSPLRWTLRSNRSLADALSDMGRPVPPGTVGALLDDMGYAMPPAAGTAEQAADPDWDAQFGHVNAVAKAFLIAGQPVISAGCVRKDLVRVARRGGGHRVPAGAPERERTVVRELPGHPGPSAAPQDLSRRAVTGIVSDLGWEAVGTGHDIDPLMISAVRRWWRTLGAERYPGASDLLVAVDVAAGGGRRWKVELAALASDFGVDITVCHLPPGRSRWNTTEHRQFSFATVTDREEGLVSYRTEIRLSGAACSESRPTAQAHWGRGYHAPQAEITDAELAGLALTTGAWRGEWNYSLGRAPADASPSVAAARTPVALPQPAGV